MANTASSKRDAKLIKSMIGGIEQKGKTAGVMTKL